MPQTARISNIYTVTSKYYPRRKLFKKTKKVATIRTANYKTLTVDKVSPHLKCFNQKLSAATQSVEKAKATYESECPIKGKLTLPSLGTTFLEHILT